MARAVVTPADQKKQFLKEVTEGTPYQRYKGIRDNLGALVRLALNPFIPAPHPSKQQIKKYVADDCIAPADIKGNQAIAEGLYDFVVKHDVTAAKSDFRRVVSLGRAGERKFWEPFFLLIDGKRYIPYLDFRQENTRLTTEAMRFVLSIQNTYVRLAAEDYKNYGLVIFQFEQMDRKGVRKAVATYHNDAALWSDKEIGAMIDEVYRVLEEICRAA